MRTWDAFSRESERVSESESEVREGTPALVANNICFFTVASIALIDGKLFARRREVTERDDAVAPSTHVRALLA